MDPIRNRELSSPPHAQPATGSRAWTPPAFEVVCLACEISAYAPDEGDPLF